MNKNKILELQNVKAGYNSDIVLREVNLNVYHNDFIGVIGSNGSGKTTLLKVILGLLPPLSGTITFNFKSKNPRRHIGYLPQISHFDNKFPITVGDVILSGLIGRRKIFQSFSQKEKDKMCAVLDWLGLQGVSTKPIGELSGGQQQKVLLGRALISDPELLLLDEPSTFMDKSSEKSFYELLVELNKKMPIILVSHDLGMISSHVKSIACVNQSIYYHESNEINQELIDNYNCPIDLITHGHLPHRVLKTHRCEDHDCPKQPKKPC